MKKAFTLIELIFVLVIVGILSSIMLSKLSNTSLRKAAQQILFHIRYTQHLALIDNRYDPKDQTWYKTRWQMLFGKNTGSNDLWQYTIFSDYAGTHTGNPDPKEIAKNPLNPQQYLTGGTSGNLLIKFTDPNATKELNIGHEYDIKDITFTHCGRAKRVIFDSLGRPVTGNTATYTKPYMQTRVLKKTCEIKLTDGDNEIITIFIEPETGYAHIK